MKALWMKTVVTHCILAAIMAAPCSVLLTQGKDQTDRNSSDANRKKEIEDLIAVLRDKELQKEDPERLKRAIQRLGELGAAEASDDLASLLAFRWPKELVYGGSHEGDRYWAKSALFQIGKPALPALVRVIESTDTATIEFKNATETVMLIHRDDRAQGPIYLRAAAKKASSALASQRLNTAASYIEAVNSKLPPQPSKPR